MEQNRSLYENLLGDAWVRVAERVRLFHCRGLGFVAHGIFRIVRPERWLGRLLAFVLRLPPASDAAALRLHVVPLEGGEKWSRDFAGRILSTTQHCDARGLMVERFTGVEFKFRITEREAGIDYTQATAGLAFWALRIPLPRWLAPHVTAREEAVGDAVRVEVKVTLPWAGLLIAYDGQLSI